MIGPIKKTYKDAPDLPEFMDVHGAAKVLVRQGYFRDLRVATAALLSGIPVQTQFAYYELATQPRSSGASSS